MPDLIARVRKGAAGQVFTQGTNVLIQITTVPLLLHFWGLRLYGDWLLLSALPSYLSMGDLGFVAATCNEMAMLVARGDRTGARRVFETTSFLVAVVACAGILGSIAVSRTVNVSAWINLGVLDQRDTALILPFFSAYVVLLMLTNVLYSGFFCEGNYGYGSFLTASIRLFEFMLLAVAVCLGARPLGAVATLVAGRGLGMVCMYRQLRKSSPGIGSGIGFPSRSVVRRLFPSAVAFGLFPAGNALNLQGMLVVIGATLGSPAAARFSTMRTLTRLPMQIINSLNGVVQPEMAAAFGKGDTPLIRQIHRASFKASLWVSLAAGTGLSAFGGSVFGAWTRGRIPMDRMLFFTLLMAALVNMLWQSSLMTAYATSRHKGVAALYALTSAAVAGSTLVTAKSYGFSAVGFILVTAELVMVAGVIPYALRLTCDGARDFLSDIIRAPGPLSQLVKYVALWSACE